MMEQGYYQMKESHQKSWGLDEPRIVFVICEIIEPFTNTYYVCAVLNAAHTPEIYLKENFCAVYELKEGESKDDV